MKMIFIRSLLSLSLLVVLWSCSDGADYSLDKSIPRLQSPVDQIAYVCTKWKNGRHIGTVFYDRRNRVLESFSFGRSSWKTLNFYEKDLPVMVIGYQHSDSSEPGHVSIDTVKREFDARGRIVQESHRQAAISLSDTTRSIGSYKLYWDYTAAGDTVLKKWEGNYDPDPAGVSRKSRWERDDQGRITRYYRFYALKHGELSDTVDHFSRRFAYDRLGRLKMAWYESMHLGRFYFPEGPDTVLYHYDSQNRLAGERHRYSTDMRNKQEIDTSHLSITDRDIVRRSRKRFLGGERHFPGNNQVDIVEYRYEPFNPARHRELVIPEAD